MLSLLDISAILLTLSGIFGWVNHKYLKLPHTIGLVIIALVASGCLMLIDFVVPQLALAQSVTGMLRAIDFNKALMEGMLSFLLFAGALHVDLSHIASQRLVISIMASVGVLISTFVVAVPMWWLFNLTGLEMPFIWALVFGALISPTDPVAVLGILKTVKIPASLEAKIAGESLFNDGVGVVVFSILLTLALSSGDGGLVEAGAHVAGSHGEGGFTVMSAIKLFSVEALGGALLGMVMGLIFFWLLRAIDDHAIEVLLTLSLVTAVYSIALHFHLSGPIAVVVTGLFIGNQGAQLAMSKHTREHVFQFWSLIDEILNSVLFLLIGLEIMVLGFVPSLVWVGLAAIPIVLFARWSAVFISIKLISIRRTFTQGAIRILTWGGLRGGISVALALSLPEGPYKEAILLATYAVVVFSIIVQGLTVGNLIARVLPAREHE